MKRKIQILLLVAICSHISITYSRELSEWEKELNIPTWVKDEFRNRSLNETYEYYYTMNPVYIRGDFDGDSEPDIAVMVMNKKTRKVGIFVVHYKGKNTFLLGAGEKIGNGGDNFDWLTNWAVERKGAVGLGASDKVPPKTTGESIFVEKTESASAVLYWDGDSYNWYQQGD